MSTANTALLHNLGLLGFTILDDLTSGTAASQSGAVALTSDVCRCTKSVSTGSFILQALLNLTAPPMVFVVNDSPNTINVYPATGENVGGVTNSPLQIPTGQSGIFVSVPNGTGGTQDWRSAVIP